MIVIISTTDAWIRGGAAIVAALPGILWAWYEVRRRREEAERAAKKSPCSVNAYAATDPADPWLHEALKLYQSERRIPDDEKTTSLDMVRWVREERDKSWIARLYCRDDLIVSVVEGKAVGLLHLTHYVLSRMAFVSYVVAKTPSSESPCTHALLDCMGRVLRGRRPRCRIALAEIDDPEATNSPVERAMRKARLRLFRSLATAQGSELRLLDVPYVQPCLDPECSGSEIPLLLLVFWIGRHGPPRTISRANAVRIVRTVYELVYGDSFLNSQAVSRKYRVYLRALTRRVTRGIPQRVRLVSPAVVLQAAADRPVA